MPTEILMPELGESVHEGTVNRWLKKEGDTVKEDEPVVEIMTDKVNTELGAPASGVLLKILVPEGQDVKVFEPVGLIGEPGEVVDGAGHAEAAPAKAIAAAGAAPRPGPAAPPAPVPAAQPPITQERRWFTPLVRSMAKEHGVTEAQLAAIPGTGEGGRVTKRDLEAYLRQPKPAAAPAAAPAAPAALTSPPPEFRPPVAATAGPEQEITPLTGMRKAIAAAMTLAHQVPAVTTVTEVDVARLVKFRKANKESFQEMYGVRLTYTPFFIKATAEALAEAPTVNGSFTADGKLLINHAVHVGVAVALGDGSEGLIVPVIRDCHVKTLIQIAKDLEDIAKRARASRIELAEVQGATFTLSNPGSYGALFGTPMIPPGQAGVLGTYAIRETAVVRDGMIAIRPIMHLVLTYDHRIIDGMLAGRFLKSIRDRLEAFDFFR
ncbi:MAG: 2-oxo acid dehydrogenase subunit E2 [Armatimonadetes bacterium]|nr:2-oxo acid dehydrogenase subunit E2 [Armatimonadota bacterium]